MTPQEFKAWFDGFTEGVAGLPNEDQWARIKARVSQIDNTPTTYPVYVDRYRNWRDIKDLPSSLTASEVKEFDSLKAMYARGRADYLAMT